MNAEGKTFPDSKKNFATLPPNIAGTWYCTEYANDGSVFETSTLELSSDGHAVATTKGGTAWFTSAEGDWKYNRVGADGFVNVSVIHETSSGSWSAKNFNGKVDNLENPSRVEGTATRSSGTNMGGGNPYVYKLVMTR